MTTGVCRTIFCCNKYVFLKIILNCVFSINYASCTSFVNPPHPTNSLFVSPYFSVEQIIVHNYIVSTVFFFHIEFYTEDVLFYSIPISDMINKKRRRNVVYRNFKSLISWHGNSVRFCCHAFRSTMPLISQLYSLYGLTGILKRPSRSIRQYNFLLLLFLNSKLGPKLVISWVLSVKKSP